MRPKGKVSQQKIAADLGISQALVSLALNGRKDGINPETYQKIWAHALSLGYEPKGMLLRESPAGARQKQVGFILRAGLNIHNQGSYFGLVLHGLHTALAATESPRLTVAGCDAEKLGATAARLILESTGGADESFNDLILPPRC